MYTEPATPNGLRPLEIEMLRTEARAATEKSVLVNKPNAALIVKTGDDWLKQERQTVAPRRLFGSFWYEHELCILFADTNMGKSVLAVQLGNALARAQPVGPFGADVGSPLTVLYIDFELSAKQFEMRYTCPDTGNQHSFGPHFYRAEFNPMAELMTNTPPRKLLEYAIEKALHQTGAQVLIIDNLTCLRSGTEQATEALALLSYLKELKIRLNLSVLLLAHTPKRNPLKPITRNDLQGSKMLINFADSAFAIGESHKEPGLRYLKQIKQRSAPEMHGQHNVCLCRLTQADWFLRYEFTGYAPEQEHLGRPQQVHVRIAELHAQGLSQRQIAAALNVSKTTVARWLGKEKQDAPAE
jgi:hypothetical protein